MVCTQHMHYMEAFGKNTHLIHRDGASSMVASVRPFSSFSTTVRVLVRHVLGLPHVLTQPWCPGCAQVLREERAENERRRLEEDNERLLSEMRTCSAGLVPERCISACLHDTSPKKLGHACRHAYQIRSIELQPCWDVSIGSSRREHILTRLGDGSFKTCWNLWAFENLCPNQKCNYAFPARLGLLRPARVAPQGSLTSCQDWLRVACVWRTCQISPTRQ